MPVPRMRLLFLFAAALALLDSRPAAAQPTAEPDSAEFAAYHMTDEALVKIRLASRAVVDTLGLDPTGVAPTGEDAPDSSGIVTRLAHEFSRRPGVRGAVETAGITIREFTLFWLSVGFAQMIVNAGEGAQERYAWYSADNVSFYLQHREEVDALYAAVQAASAAADQARQGLP